MPLSINDSRLKSLYTTFENQQATNGNFKIGTDQALQILSEVGDRSGWTPAKVLTELKKPGVTRDQQIALAQKGMSAGEKKDIALILDSGKVPLDPAAKSFLEAVIGRTPTPPTPPTPPVGGNGLTITGDQKNGLSGVAKAGATIEAINISAAPAGRLHMDDTMVIGKADANGQFSAAKLTGDQAIHEGDLIRMRARNADGTTSDW